jgi:putative adhesin
MRTFETPEPIDVTLEMSVGGVRIDATERADTRVDVRPSDPSTRSDVIAAEQTRVEYANGRLLVRAPKGWRQWGPLGPSGHGSIEVEIDLPAGSSLSGQTGVGALRCTGSMGGCRFRTGVGDIRVEEAGPVELRTGAGDMTLERVDGAAEVKTGSGSIGIGSVDGRAIVRNGNGDTWIGEVTGEARVNAANGGISIDRARAGVVAKTANGNVRLGQVERGAAVAQSAFGSVEVGVRDRVAAWLDLDTKFGTVHNELDATDRPGSSEDPVEVHAHTSMGDITIRRSVEASAGEGARTS